MDLACGFLPGILFRGKNLLLCKLLLFSDQISGGGEQKSLREHPLWKKARLQTVLCDYGTQENVAYATGLPFGLVLAYPWPTFRPSVGIPVGVPWRISG